MDRGEQSVTRRRVVEQNHMAGLLAAEDESAVAHRLQHVAVAHRRIDVRHSRRLHREPESLVGHDRRHHGVVPQPALFAQRERQDGQDLVTVDQGAAGVHREAAVGVAVVCDARVGPDLDNLGLQVLGVRGPAAVVDVEAIGLGVQGHHLGAQQPQRLGSRAVGRAVGAVDDDLEPVQPVRGGRDDVVDVAPPCIGVVHYAPYVSPRGALPSVVEVRLDGVLDRVIELVPALGEELDAVVRHGVVARGDHDPDIGS